MQIATIITNIPSNYRGDQSVTRLNYTENLKRKVSKLFEINFEISFGNLKSILCQNRSKFLRNFSPGVYQLHCS